ncbi:MAG: hypothetical protein OEV44_15130, partial [Spirochaetota bacterium]|nr:hypothetical protein [Spirochaetota bacterium]
IRIEKKDARELIEMYSDRPATLIYLDPPYFIKRDHKYVIDAQDETFHQELLEKCLNAKCMILLSGYDNKLYNDMLVKNRGWTKEKIKTTTCDTTGIDYERTEILWKNPLFIKARNNNRVPIRLSEKEKKTKKINPRRMCKKK